MLSSLGVGEITTSNTTKCRENSRRPRDNDEDEDIAPPSKKRSRSSEDYYYCTEHAVKVSNLPPDDCCEQTLTDWLNDKLKRGLAITVGDPIVKCRLDKEDRTTAYVELRSKKELRKLLQWNGILRFCGFRLALSSWVPQSDHAVHVSNLPNSGCSTNALKHKLNHEMFQRGLLITPGGGNAILNCQYDKENGCAYVELRSMEEMRNLIQLNGVLTCNRRLLKIQTWNADAPQEEEEAQSLVVVHDSDYQDHRNSHHHGDSYSSVSPNNSYLGSGIHRRVFIHSKPQGVSLQELGKFLNDTMKKEGLAEEDAIVCSDTKLSQHKFGFFSMANEEMAEKLVCLTGIQMHDQYVLLSRHRACTKQPRYANWTEYKHSKEGVDPQVTLYLKEEPSTTTHAHRFVTFLNQKMNHFELCRGNAVVGCYRVHPGLEHTTWVVQLASEDVADKLLYLNRIIWGGSILSLRRHENYQGVPPKFSNFQEFVAKRQRQVRKVSFYAASLAEENCDPSLPNRVSPDKPDTAAAKDGNKPSSSDKQPEEISKETSHDSFAFNKPNSCDEDIVDELSDSFCSEMEESHSTPMNDAIYQDVESEIYDSNDAATNLLYLPKLCLTDAKEEKSVVERVSYESRPADTLFQKQELMILQELASAKLENDRVKHEFTKLAAEHIDLKHHFGRVKEENELLKVYKEMEKAISSGSQDQPIDLGSSDEEAKNHAKLVEAEAASAAAETTRIEKAAAEAEKTRLSKEVCSKVCRKLVEAKKAAKTATSEKEAAEAESTRLSKELSNANAMLVAAEKAGTASTTAEAEAKAETLRVSKQLATTQLQLDAVHQSWQEQAQQLMDHQQHIAEQMHQQPQLAEIKARLDDTERRFREVTNSLAVQTTELAEERHAQRELQADLTKERKMRKKTKRTLQSAHLKLKEETYFDV